MRVKILRSVAGLAFSFQEGQVVELDDGLAADLIRARHAEPPVGEIETASREPPETAVLPRRRKGAK